MAYLVAVMSDRIRAEQASLDLEGVVKATLFGRGFASADTLELLAPVQSARRKMRGMALWLLPFGFGSGTVFSVISHLQTFAWAGEWGNHLIGGLLGMVAAAMGSVFVGGGAGLVSGDGESSGLRKSLEAGNYLVVVQGSLEELRQASQILEPLQPVSLQSFADRTSV